MLSAARRMASKRRCASSSENWSSLGVVLIGAE
jgi:hypothetical protein